MGKHSKPAANTPETQSGEVWAWLTPHRRKKLYGIATAIIPLLVIYGILDENTAPLWLALAGSILATGTATLHTNR